MQTSIRSTTDSTQNGDLPRTENDGGNSWKRLRSSLGLARDDDDDEIQYLRTFQTGFYPDMKNSRYCSDETRWGHSSVGLM